MKSSSLLVIAVVAGVSPRLARGQTVPSPENETPFASVSFLGSASLIAGELTEEDGATVASGGVGFVAATAHDVTLRGVFTFGTAGASESAATAKDYINFLQVPTSALGIDLHLAYLPTLGDSSVRLGASFNLRGSHQEFGFGDDAREGINVIGLDPSLSLLVPLAPEKSIFFSAEVGMAMRFWNQPAAKFVEALDLDSSKHAFAGVHALAAMNIGNIHVGVEMMRLWGGGLDELKEFAIIPYVGFRGGLAPPSPPPPPKPECDCTTQERLSAPRPPLRGKPAPAPLPPTQVM